MSCVAPAAAIDPREEMDDAVLQAARSRTAAPTTALKTKFLIRTLPKDCNPTPVTAAAASPSLLSPTARKSPHSSAALLTVAATETDEHLPDNPFDDITEEKLQKLSGNQDLSRVTYLQIAVDSGKQSVEAIGELLPSLQQLKLQHSTLHSFRDLGTSLHSLRILWVMRSGITDLDGIGALTHLQELYLQYNDISDLSPLTLHEEIQVIDLEGNCIADIGQVEQLAFCAQLTTLNLEANPVCKLSRYRQIVANFLPQLTTLDDKPITDPERLKISDDEIDAAIQLHRDELLAVSAAPSTVVDDRQLIADGIKAASSLPSAALGSHIDDRSPRKLARNASAQRIAGFDAAADAMRNDSGSSLTHGTDIVFAGNVTSSLRRHRSETESTDAHLAALAEQLAAAVGGSDSENAIDGRRASLDRPKTPMLERPKTPARMSITDTLDRAHELETQKHKSRDAILNELKAWQQEGTVSQLGVTHVARQHPHHRDKHTTGSRGDRSPTKTSKRRSSSTRTADVTERRPNTSAGVLRNGASVREAFVETERDRESSSRAGAAGTTRAPLHRRSSFSSSSSSMASRTVSPSLTGSSGHVDILILDDGDAAAERRPCSPTKSSKGIFTTTSAGREWNLDALVPTLDLSTAEASWRNFPQSSARQQQHQNDRVFQKTHRRGAEDDDDDRSSGDDSSESEGDTVVRSRHASSRRTSAKILSSKASAHGAAFFNVAESLHAIDKWRDDMDDDDKPTVRQHESLSPRPTESASTAPVTPSAAIASLPQTPSLSANQHQEERGSLALHHHHTLQLGPANFETDERIVQFMKEKHKVVAETKTRDGFRRFFRGIEAERLERILQHVFADPEKVRRRLQLMSGFYRHELSS